MLREFYELGKSLCEEEGTELHQVNGKFSIKLELGYDINGALKATLNKTEEFENTLPLERVRTSNVYAYLFCDFAESGREGEVKSPIPQKYLAEYIKKHKEVVPKEDELFHAWLNCGCSVLYCDNIECSRFDLIIDGERAVDKYDCIVRDNIKNVANEFGMGLWEEGPLVDNASKVSDGNSLISYNSYIFKNNRPSLKMTLGENKFIMRGWQEMKKGRKLLYEENGTKVYVGSISKIQGGEEPSIVDVVTIAPYSKNADEIMQKYKRAKTTQNTELDDAFLMFFGVTKGRFEYRPIIQENAASLFENIEKFRKDCGDFADGLESIVVKHYPTADGKKAKQEYLKKTTTLFQSIWTNKPILSSDIAPIVSGLSGFKHFKNPYLFFKTFSGALALSKCYLKRKGVTMDNYMYIAGQIMAHLHNRQNAIHYKYKVGGADVIWGLTKGLERPDRMIGLALEKIRPYWTEKYGGPDQKVMELLSKIEQYSPKDVCPMNKTMCFHLGFASVFNKNEGSLS